MINQDTINDISNINNMTKTDLAKNNYQTENMKVDGVLVERIVPKGLDDFAIRNPGGMDYYEMEFKRGAQQVPNRDDIDMNLDRTARSSRGVYQTGLKAERLALMADLQKVSKDLLREASARGMSFAPNELINALKFIPNSRFAYYNALIRNGVQNRRFSQDDIDFVNTVWMNERTKSALKNFFGTFLDRTISGFTIRPPPTRGGISMQPAEGDGVLALRLANPGTLQFPVSYLDKQPSDTSISELVLKMIDESMNRLVEQSKIDMSLKPLYDIAPINSPLARTLLSVRDKLITGDMTYEELAKQIDSISRFIGLKRSKYLSSLADPFHVRGARVPSLISPPSACFSVRSIIPLTTNALGNVAFFIVPNYLLSSTGTTSNSAVNNAATLTGLASDNNFNAISIGQILPADFYVRYRLVSAGMRVYVYPSSNNDNGLLTTSVTYETVVAATIGAVVTSAAQFGDFSQIENGFYKQTTTIASREVQEQVYLPIDEAAWDYQQVGLVGKPPSWVGYITGASPSTTIARLEVIMNFEAILDNQYTDYLPSESLNDNSDPRVIFGGISALKEAPNLSPPVLKEVLREVNTDGYTMSDKVSLPPPEKQTSLIKDVTSTMTNIAKNIVNEQLQKLQPQEKSNWLGNVLGNLSPVLQTIVGSGFPPLFLPGKF